MRNLWSLAGALASVFTVTNSMAQSWSALESTPKPNVISALSSGDAAALASFFEASIELTIEGQEGAYSKAQAEQVVRSFFAAHSPSSFVKKHESSSGGNAHFAVGTLVTSNGSFRVDIFYKTVNGQVRIQRLKFTES
jgi:hypothetical protein